MILSIDSLDLKRLIFETRSIFVDTLKSGRRVRETINHTISLLEIHKNYTCSRNPDTNS